MRAAIDTLLKQPEGKTLEFKRDLSSPRNVLKTLVAFANSAGGRLIVGLTDDRQVLGVTDPLAAEERLCNLVADSIAPRLVPNVELASHGDKTLLVVEVFPSSSRPHHLVRLGPERGVLIRLGSSNRQAGPDLVAQMRRSAQGLVFDELPMPALDKDALDLAAVKRLLGSAHRLDDKALTTLKLVAREQGRLVPTQGGMLLFGHAREQYFPDAWVQCGRFRGADKTEIFDQIEIHAHLPEAVPAIEQFLQKHAFKSARFGGMQREDVWSIPMTMLREAIVNALVHADYALRGSPVRIAFHDARITIESPGWLLPGMTVGDMKSGVSRIRNPVIARVFRELRLIEQWGSGIRRIFAEAERLGLPEPGIMETATGLRVTIALGEAQTLPTGSPASANTPQGEQVSEQVSEQVAIILTRCSLRPHGKQELLAALGLANAWMNYKRHIAPLVDKGWLALTVPDKPRSRLQRYRLTDLGRQVLAGIHDTGHIDP